MSNLILANLQMVQTGRARAQIHRLDSIRDTQIRNLTRGTLLDGGGSGRAFAVQREGLRDILLDNILQSQNFTMNSASIQREAATRLLGIKGNFPSGEPLTLKAIEDIVNNGVGRSLWNTSQYFEGNQTIAQSLSGILGESTATNFEAQRETVRELSASDRQAIGSRMSVSSSGCDFCLLVAGGDWGAASSFDSNVHANCSCMEITLFEEQPNPPHVSEAMELQKEAQARIRDQFSERKGTGRETHTLSNIMKEMRVIKAERSHGS